MHKDLRHLPCPPQEGRQHFLMPRRSSLDLPITSAMTANTLVNRGRTRLRLPPQPPVVIKPSRALTSQNIQPAMPARLAANSCKACRRCHLFQSNLLVPMVSLDCHGHTQWQILLTRTSLQISVTAQAQVGQRSPTLTREAPSKMIGAAR